VIWVVYGQKKPQGWMPRGLGVDVWIEQEFKGLGKY
jgi:hypothetical protein